MNNLSNYLQKFKTVVPYERQVKDIVIPIIKARCGFDLKYNQITVNGRVVSFELMPIEKQLIFMHKAFIIKALEVRGIAIETLL